MSGAEQDLTMAMQVAPKSPLPYLRFGQLRVGQKRWDDAERLLAQALELDPKNVDAMKGLLTVDFARKQPAKASARLNTQITKFPNVGGFYDLLAAFQISQGDYSSAEDTLQRDLKLNPQDPAAVQLYTQVELKLGKADNAIHAWEQWINSHPNDAQAYALLGSLEETRNRDKAQTYYQKALQLKPDQPIAANNLAYLMLETGKNIDMALSLAQTARRLTPDSVNTADTLAWAYYYKGNYSLGRDLLENALKAAPNNATIHYHLGMICLKLSDQNNASLHFKRVLTLAPNTPTAENAKKALGTIS
jgi:tetratricopeptide (TPR) repeat protein